MPPVPFERDHVEAALTRLLPSETIEQFARETGFIERERKVHPVAFLWVLVLHFGTRLTRRLAELKKGYDKRLGLATITYPGFYLRFTPELSKFLKRCLEHALGELAREPGRELDPKLAAFEDIFLTDSTVVRLHASLATKWPATRSRTIAAGGKGDTLVSVRANGPKTLARVGERTPEVKLLRVGPWGKNRSLLADLGFYSHRSFVTIVENGGSFVRRAKASADPRFVRSFTVHRGRAIDLEGKRLSEVLPRLDREILDAEVELSFKRRVYNGRRAGDTARFRLVAVGVEAHREYHTYLTNIGPEILSAEEVASLYRMRWEIELTFKELKSQYALDAFRTTNANIVEALIWAALLTLVASRRIYTLVRTRAPPELRPRYTPMMWSIEFREGGSAVLGCRLAHLGYEEFSEKEWQYLNYRRTVCALTSHIRRPPVREV